MEIIHYLLYGNSFNIIKINSVQIFWNLICEQVHELNFNNLFFLNPIHPHEDKRNLDAETGLRDRKRRFAECNGKGGEKKLN